MGNYNLNSYEPRGQEFESLRAHHIIKRLTVSAVGLFCFTLQVSILSK